MVGGSPVWLSSSAVSGPVPLRFFWPLSCGHEMAAAAPGIILTFKAGRRGERSGTCLLWFFFFKLKSKISPITYYLVSHWSVLGHFAIPCCHQARWKEDRIVMTIFNVSWSITGCWVHCHPRQNWDLLEGGMGVSNVSASHSAASPAHFRTHHKASGASHSFGNPWNNDNWSPHLWIGGCSLID